MAAPLHLDPDRFFPSEPEARRLARALYGAASHLPIISPHGHTDPAWFALDEPFGNASELLLVPDHYILRMLYSQGVSLEALGVATAAGDHDVVDPRAAWRSFASHYHLFRGTPCRIWLDHVFSDVFGLDVRLDFDTADHYYDHITGALQSEAFRPRAILDRFNVEVIATTEGALDDLRHHRALHAEGWGERVITTFRPDDVLDPASASFASNVEQLGALTGEVTTNWSGYLNALRARREVFRALGATATDHGHPTPHTENLDAGAAAHLFEVCLRGEASADQKEQFRGQMLTEMARMSLDDHMVMQLHAGVHRNHNRALFDRFGPDKGADIPTAANFVDGLKPLLDAVGNEADLELILFTLDETTYARELAPLAGHYPCLRLGPPWWFHDSPEGMMRYRRQMTESAGFYNTAGFNDDTRALLSIPARHDLARRMDARFLAELTVEHRLDEDEAFELMEDLTVNLVRKAYRLGERGKKRLSTAAE